MDMTERYVRAEQLLPWNANRLTSDLTIEPHWFGQHGQFWYRFRSATGTEFVVVDPEPVSVRPAFDHDRLAVALSAASGDPCTARELPFDEIEFTSGTDTIRFKIDGTLWSCDLISYTCHRLEETQDQLSDGVRSPDGQWEVFTRAHNVRLREVATGTEHEITGDGEPGYGYGDRLPSPLAGAGLAQPARPDILWSPDSRKFLFSRIDQRTAPQLHLVQSVPLDGSVRPRLHAYAYPLPGDETTPTAEIFSTDLDTDTLIKLDIEPIPLLHYGSPINPYLLWWSEDNQTVYLIRRGRGYLRYDLVAIDAETGAARILVEEQSETAIDPDSLNWNEANIRVVSGSSRVVWYSQRDRWGHLYLHDAASGKLLRQITNGPWEVDQIQHVDETNGLVYFTAIGRETDRDPYFTHLYRVRLDSGEPELLTPEDADHTVRFAPDGRYFLDTFSTVATQPQTVLRTADGELVYELHPADISQLESTGWRPPERFHAKARDGVSTVYGVILWPSDFDPARQYPVIDYIYGGPHINQAPTSFAESGRGRGDYYWHAQAIAELGFIVVMMDGLGMPGRSKERHDVSYRNLADGGIEDHIAALRQLADRYPYFDLSRVGIFGHSAGGYASAQAILRHPDFFKVCVSSAGNHDHRLDKASWVERYMGSDVGDHYREQANQTIAHRLKGKLLLAHGEMDENVHPSSTMVLVDALIKANKDFDLLIMPYRDHGLARDPYFTRRRWDYFVRHLLGEQPPENYRIELATE